MMRNQTKLLISAESIIILISLSCCLESSVTQAEGVKEGEQVMVTVQNAKIMQGIKQVSKVNMGDVMKVTQVNGVWLGIASKKGWILESQIVPISQAVDHFTKKIKEKPVANYYFFRGVAHLIAKKNEKAINDLNEAIRRDPKISDYLTNRGLAYNNLKQNKQAIIDFSAAIKLNPKDANAYYNRAVLLKKQHQYDKAMADLDASIKIDSHYAFAFSERADLWRKQKQYGKAIADCSQAIKLDPKNAHAFTYRGSSKKMLKQYAEAIKDYLTAIQLDPQDPTPRNGLAWLLATCQDQKHRDGKQALKHAKKACDLWDNKDFNGLDTLAAAYAETGEFEKAIQWCDKALAITPQEAKQALEKRKNFYKKGKPFHE